MKFAIVDGIRCTAKPKLLGKCICCNNTVRSYCGKERVHHWKHITAKECDPWYEGETEWHRNWKGNFNHIYQEVVKYDDLSGEKHIADIYIEQKDLVIEFQHSPISIEEIQSRELFYKRMIWVINVRPYYENISFHEDLGDAYEQYIHKPLINKKYNKVKELENKGLYKEANTIIESEYEWNYYEEIENRFFPDYYTKRNRAFAAKRTLERLDELRGKNPQIQGYSFSDENLINLRNWSKEHFSKEFLLMVWKYKHKRWDHAKMPMFFDLGDDSIYRCLENIKFGNGLIVKKYSKQFFIDHYKC